MVQRITLKSICRQIGVRPRQARRRLRGAKLRFHECYDRWEFNEKQAARALRIAFIFVPGVGASIGGTLLRVERQMRPFSRG